ncbi:MAG: DUF2141 domain-containing protein [Alphaproteobacteria bacterium]|nr:DUF2141 domain-containing protein [Alphaproteobacteria bacterium]
MRLTILLLAALGTAAAAAPATPNASSPTVASLEVSFTGVEPARGAVRFALFDSAEGYDGKAAPVRGFDLPATAETVTATIPGLAPGRYAIKAFYDANGNGRMDTNPFGMPIEPFAFSNNAKGAMGPAAWADAAFDVTAAGAAQRIAFK